MQQTHRYIPLAVKVFAILLPLQYLYTAALSNWVREPWPTMVFPGFASVYHDGHYVHLNQAVFDLLDGDDRFLWRIPAHRLDVGLPESQQSALGGSRLKALLEMVVGADSEFREWIGTQVVESFLREGGLGEPAKINIVQLRQSVDAKGVRIVDEEIHFEIKLVADAESFR